MLANALTIRQQFESISLLFESVRIWFGQCGLADIPIQLRIALAKHKEKCANSAVVSRIEAISNIFGLEITYFIICYMNSLFLSNYFYYLQYIFLFLCDFGCFHVQFCDFWCFVFSVFLCSLTLFCIYCHYFC